MRAVVTYPFRDRETGEVRYAGDLLDLSAERIRELRNGGFVDEQPDGGAEPGDGPVAPEPGTPADEPGTPADEPGPPDAAAMTAAELREAIESRGGFAPRKATKAQLAEILGTL